MAELLLLNPRRRRRVARRNPVRARRRARRRNPIARKVVLRRPLNPRMRGMAAPNPRKRRRARRRNPVAVAMRRNRRLYNPSRLGSARGWMKMLTDAAIGAAGAAAVNFGWNKIQSNLPSTLQTSPASVGAGDAVKAAATVILGMLLNKATRGASIKAASGALTVQMFAALQKSAPTLGIGFYSPAQIVQGSQRIGPNKAITGNGAGAQSMRRYTAPGETMLLSRYMQPGRTPLLSGGLSMQEREGNRR